MNRAPLLRGAGRSVAALATAAVVAAGLTLGPVSSAMAGGAPPAGSVPPDQDPFYQAPANIGSYAPGQIVATRPVTGSGVSGVDAWQISYRTNDAHNRP